MHDRERTLNILGWGAFAFACSVFLLPVINPDLFWHLSAGRWAAQHFGPPRADSLSWTMNGAPWVDFEWLTQGFYYLLYKAGGFPALLALKAAVFVLLLLVFRACALMYGRRAALVPALPFLAAALMSNSDLRPENFTLLFFTVTLYLLERARLKGLAPGWKPAAAAFVFFALWTNLHAGYMYGLALIGLYAAGEFLEEELPFIYGRAPFARPARALWHMRLFAAGLAASLVNPYGWNIYGVLANHQKYMADLQAYIQEWHTFDLLNAYQWPYVLALPAVFGCFAWFLLRRRHVRYAHLAALIFFAWASANHARHIPFFVLTGLAYTLALPWESVRLSGRGRALAAAGAAAFLLLTGLYYNRFVWRNYAPGATDFKNASEGLASFLKAEKGTLAGLRMYNPWGWGGWLGWELGPDYKVFMDGRYLFHEKIPEAIGLTENSANWKPFLEKYGFGLVVLQLGGPQVPVKQTMPGGGTAMLWRPDYLFYLPRRDWAVVYWDVKIAVLARRSAVPAGWLAAHEYKWLRPGDLINIVPPLAAGGVPLRALRAEASRYLRGAEMSGPCSAANGVALFMRDVERLCGYKGIRCSR